MQENFIQDRASHNQFDCNKKTIPAAELTGHVDQRPDSRVLVWAIEQSLRGESYANSDNPSVQFALTGFKARRTKANNKREGC